MSIILLNKNWAPEVPVITGTFGVLGNELWNPQDLEGEAMLPRASLWTREQAVTKAAGLGVSKSEDDNYQDSMRKSRVEGPLPHPNTRLLLKHVSLTKQLTNTKSLEYLQDHISRLTE